MSDLRFLPPNQRNAVLFFGLAYLIAWLFWFPAALATSGRLALPVPSDLAWLLGAWAPAIAAICLTLVRREGLRQLLGRVIMWRVGVVWYVVALALPVLLSLATTGVALLGGSPAPDFAHPPVLDAYSVPPEARAAGWLALLPVVFVIQFFGSSLGEELGWRGYALPRLQTARSALTASVGIGFLWGIWHFPRQWTPGEAYDWTAFAALVASLSLWAIVYTWIFNRTRGSLLPVLLLHTSQALTGLFVAAVDAPWISVLVLLMLVSLILWRTRLVPEMDVVTPQATVALPAERH